MALNTHDCLADITPIIKDRLVIINGGVHEHMMATYPGSRRTPIKDCQELEDFWWNDVEHFTEIKDQRTSFQCEALLYKRDPQDAYQRALKMSKTAGDQYNTKFDNPKE